MRIALYADAHRAWESGIRDFEPVNIARPPKPRYWQRSVMHQNLRSAVPTYQTWKAPAAEFERLYRHELERAGVHRILEEMRSIGDVDNQVVVAHDMTTLETFSGLWSEWTGEAVEWPFTEYALGDPQPAGEPFSRPGNVQV